MAKTLIENGWVIPMSRRDHTIPDGAVAIDGDTLVVETINFRPDSSFNGSDENMRLTERFTRSDTDTLLYQFTVNDPGTYTRPWSGEITMKPFEGTILEYACTEANQALYDIMSGARVQEREAAGK